MDAEDYAAVVKAVCVELGIYSATQTLIRNVTWYCRGLNLGAMNYPSKGARNAAIAKMYVASIAQVSTTADGEAAPFDVEAYARNVTSREDKKEDTAQGGFGPLTSWIGAHMPLAASKSMAVYVDSRDRKITNQSSITDFEFRIAPRRTHVAEVDGHIVANEVPTLVTYFKISRLMLPYDAVLRQRNCTNEITLTFTGIRSSGILAHEDTYHFVFYYDTAKNPQSKLVELVPVNQYCKFSPPLRIVEDLTMRFNDPVYPIKFSPDRLRPVSFNYNSTEGRIAFDVAHGLTTGDVIVIMGLGTRSDVDNADVLAVINDPRGVVISEIDTFIIATNINFSRLKLPDTTSLPWVLVTSRTFRFPLEIGYQGTARA